MFFVSGTTASTSGRVSSTVDHRLQQSGLHDVVGTRPTKVLVRTLDRFEHPSMVPKDSSILGRPQVL